MAYNAEDFSRMALAAFPDLAEEFEEWAGLLHLKMGAFAQITQGAKGDGDWEKYDRCIRLADTLFGSATPTSRMRSMFPTWSTLTSMDRADPPPGNA
jgi:hypothetical protein